jgi:hypothetical protein
MVTYVLCISKIFPATHKKKGLETNFVDLIESKIKVHTIRGNYKLWQKRFEKIANGEACLSIRNWTGKPYNSKQVEVFRLTREDRISLEKLEFHKDKDGIHSLKFPLINNKYEPEIAFIAWNDGLSLDDFKDWFRNANLSNPLAIIHFTHFRYSDLC